MIRVINQLEIGKYTVLILDAPTPLTQFRKIKIDGKIYEPNIVYDLPQSIGILGTGTFLGKEVKFI